MIKRKLNASPLLEATSTIGGIRNSQITQPCTRGQKFQEAFAFFHQGHYFNLHVCQSVFPCIIHTSVMSVVEFHGESVEIQ